MAGTAKVSITPASEPVHDPIFARCLILALDNQRYAFVSVDLPGMASDKVKQICKEKYGIDHLLICSSHNHSAPFRFSKTDYSQMERMGQLLAYHTVKVAKSIPAGNTETTIKYMEDSLQFTGRFDKTLHFGVHISSLLINDDILIATSPGELFVQLALDWKSRIQKEIPNPLFFGYTWNQGGSPGYVPDIKGAALGGFGADQNEKSIEVGAGEQIMNRHYENYFRLNGLMRNEVGPSGFTRGSTWEVILYPQGKK
ncbi:hypothetical protein FACS189440_09370 [Bacteroidia bacterium]|nr:hypothetical protein FACS189440_09370 [Bacteroidia bacterium]